MNISKNDLWNYLFGDIFRYLLLKYKISPLDIPFLLFTAAIYYLIIRKHKKGLKYSKMEQLYIFYWWISLVLAIVLQVFVISIAKWND